MVTREPDVTRLVDKLVTAGWVQRARSEEDRRVVSVSLTASGKKLVEKLDEPMMDLHRKTLGHLTKTEIKEFNRLLVKARLTAEA